MAQEFKDTKETAEKLGMRWLENNGLQDCIFYAVKDLVHLYFPIQRKTVKDDYLSATCPIFWEGLSSCIEAHLKQHTFDKVKTSESEMSSHLVYVFIGYVEVEVKIRSAQIDSLPSLNVDVTRR